MLHATTWESCPAELLLSAAAPEDTGKTHGCWNS